MYSKLDRLDMEILNQFLLNARIPNKQLASIINRSSSNVSVRIKKIESSGVIKGYSIILDLPMLGKNMTSVVKIKLTNNSSNYVDAFFEKLKDVRDIVNFYKMNGKYDLFLFVVVADMSDYSSLIDEISKMKDLKALHSNILLNELKGRNFINLPYFQQKGKKTS